MRKTIIKTVEDIVKRYGTRDPKALCDALGIQITKSELPNSTNGFFFSLSGRKAIVINSMLKGKKENYCISHELGHALLHEELNSAFLSQSTCFAVGRYEREADLFAAYLLLGAPNIQSLAGKTVNEISAITHLPIESVKEWINTAA